MAIEEIFPLNCSIPELSALSKVQKRWRPVGLVFTGQTGRSLQAKASQSFRRHDAAMAGFFANEYPAIASGR